MLLRNFDDLSIRKNRPSYNRCIDSNDNIFTFETPIYLRGNRASRNGFNYYTWQPCIRNIPMSLVITRRYCGIIVVVIIRLSSLPQVNQSLLSPSLSLSLIAIRSANCSCHALHIFSEVCCHQIRYYYNLHYFYYVCDCVCVCASVCMLLLLRIPNSRTNLVLPLQCILSIYVDFMLFYVILCCSPFSALFSHHQDDHYFGIYLVARSRQEPAGSQQ